MLSIEFIVKTVTTGGRRKQINVQIQLASVTLVTYRTALSQTELSVQNSIESLDQSGVPHVSLQFAFSHLFYFIYFCAELNFFLFKSWLHFSAGWPGVLHAVQPHLPHNVARGSLLPLLPLLAR